MIFNGHITREVLLMIFIEIKTTKLWGIRSKKGLENLKNGKEQFIFQIYIVGIFLQNNEF